VNPLPFAYITWEPSVEPLPSFLRYQVYRRRDAGPWLRIATLSNRDQPLYQDYTVSAGPLYEYAVTQVATDTAGEEIESDLPTPVGISVTFRDWWIHAVDRPEVYVELMGATAEVAPRQDVRLRERWDGSFVGFVGPRTGDVVSISGIGTWQSDEEVWEALRELEALQRTEGRTLCLRGPFGERVFGLLRSFPRQHGTSMFDVGVVFEQTRYPEEVV
jgi:hypothetical protein